MAEAPASNLITVFEDSRRWRNVVRRDGDIVISTPPKSGTTWTQGIVTSLLWPAGDAPGRRLARSPWLDSRTVPVTELAERLEQQQHRRCLKTHSPGDCIPFDPRCRYLMVYRDGRDALVSWGNHRATMRPAIVEALNTVAAKEGVAPLNPRWQGDYDELFEEWQMVGSPTRHLASWWPRRHLSNVLFVHYNDLSADVEHEMRRIAAFLEITLKDEEWPAVVERCRLDAMRSAAEAEGGMDRIFDGGASAFYFKGTNGRWRGILTDEQVERYLATVAAELPANAAAWLEHGSLALQARPEEIDLGVGEHTGGRPSGSNWHPVFSRLGRERPTNSIDAIAERRVEQARDAGLFEDLELHGKPIPDIDRQRQPGWWANRFVAQERNKVTALQIEQELREAMPALWRLTTTAAVAGRVDELNRRIERYNRATTLEPMQLLEPTSVLATWQRLQDRL